MEKLHLVGLIKKLRFIGCDKLYIDALPLLCKELHIFFLRVDPWNSRSNCQGMNFVSLLIKVILVVESIWCSQISFKSKHFSPLLKNVGSATLFSVKAFLEFNEYIKWLTLTSPVRRLNTFILSKLAETANPCSVTSRDIIWKKFSMSFQKNARKYRTFKAKIFGKCNKRYLSLDVYSPILFFKIMKITEHMSIEICWQKSMFLFPALIHCHSTLWQNWNFLLTLAKGN